MGILPHSVVGPFATMVCSRSRRVDKILIAQVLGVYQVLHHTLRSWRSTDITQANKKNINFRILFLYCHNRSV
jgi:hypothetical protein